MTSTRLNVFSASIRDLRRTFCEAAIWLSGCSECAFRMGRTINRSMIAPPWLFASSLASHLQDDLIKRLWVDHESTVDVE
jgi:hypothetical protein